MNCLTKITENGKDETSEIEILGNVILTFFDCLIYVGNCFIEIVFVEVKYSSVVVKCRNMIIGKLWKVGNADSQILDGFLEVSTPTTWVTFFLEVVLDDFEGEIQVGLRFIGDEFDRLLYGLS